ncbi:putative protein farnesyltransferase [Dioscorea sansibarensis]
MESSPSSSASSARCVSPHSLGEMKLSITQLEQQKVESKVFEIYRHLAEASPQAKSFMVELWRDKHTEFLTKGLRKLGRSFEVLDANRPWLCYWILHSIALLGEHVDSELENNVVDFLSRCQDKDGGYGGGPGQMPHLATTYAAVNTLVTLGSERALSSIDRGKMYEFLLQMKDASGAFRMHDGGEIDVRACYTAISVASILNILDSVLIKDVGNFIWSCQTYEGGIAGEPGSEAHGGYTFCGLAAMILINEADKLDMPSLIDWAVFRQGVECGFQGRTNKLVDGCYSFWQGGALALIQKLLSAAGKQSKESPLCGGQASEESMYNITLSPGGKLSDVGFAFMNEETECGPLFHTIALQQYLLLCSQIHEGGFRDKPGKSRDHYHTCYCLSGLSVSQYSRCKDPRHNSPLPTDMLGPYLNLLEPIHPLYNVVLDKYDKAREFFSAF